MSQVTPEQKELMAEIELFKSLQANPAFKLLIENLKGQLEGMSIALDKCEDPTRMAKLVGGLATLRDVTTWSDREIKAREEQLHALTSGNT